MHTRYTKLFILICICIVYENRACMHTYTGAGKTHSVDAIIFFGPVQDLGHAMYAEPVFDMYMYVCLIYMNINIRIYACIYVYIYVYRYTCMYVWVPNIYIHNIYIYIYIFMYI
jgi:hypothetical protein